jgi:uncharacterized protein YqeY
MSLAQKVSEEIKLAMKSGDKLRLETLRLLRAQLVEKEIAKRGKGQLTEEDEIGVLQSALKKRKESIELFKKGGRNDLVEKEQSEIEVLQTFLPEQLAQPELEQIVKKIVLETGAFSGKDFGKVMSAVMKTLRGKAEGELIQKIVRNELEKNAKTMAD